MDGAGGWAKAKGALEAPRDDLPAELPPSSRSHKLWRPETRAERLALLAVATALPTSPAVVSAKRLLALSLAKLLTTLETQLDAHRRQIEAAFQAHPDQDVFGYLPGAKPL